MHYYLRVTPKSKEISLSIMLSCLSCNPASPAASQFMLFGHKKILRNIAVAVNKKARIFAGCSNLSGLQPKNESIIWKTATWQLPQEIIYCCKQPKPKGL
ncbi:MAG: hypothetical protein ACOC12_10270 [Bacteroidota bacterium]